MILRTSALWACLLVASVSFAQQKSYIVQEGDTLGGIAAKNGISSETLAKANPAIHPDKLKIGVKLFVPAKVSISKTTATSGGYVVRNGDHDWLIAKKSGVTVAKLHELNPNVKWRVLQIGARLNVPSAPKVAVVEHVAEKPVKAGGKVTVREGENDWIIARKVGVTVSTLHKLNPNVNWSKIQIGQSLNIPGGVSPIGKVASITTSRAKVSKESVNVRSKPGTGGEMLATVAHGTMAKLLDREGSWYKLRFVGGTVGWVRGDMLAPVKAAAVVASHVSHYRSRPTGRRHFARPEEAVAMNQLSEHTGLLDQAYRYKGVRYRYGGTSRSGVDCSGFTSTVYRSQGLRLPRTAAEQSRVGKYVGKGQLHQGDLLFFKTNRGTRINHVGIYIGNGKFIHASSGGGRVRTDTINQGYYSRRYAGAKRVMSRLAKAKVAKADHIAMKKAEKKLDRISGSGSRATDTDPGPESR